MTCSDPISCIVDPFLQPSSGGDARIYANHKADVITSSNDRQTTASLSTSAEVSGWGVQVGLCHRGAEISMTELRSKSRPFDQL